jgi:hypothetical protein
MMREIHASAKNLFTRGLAPAETLLIRWRADEAVFGLRRQSASGDGAFARAQGSRTQATLRPGQSGASKQRKFARSGNCVKIA